ncbi:hypothetical protein JYU04_02905 [Dehalococcoides mccartyi]|nr:hypothetical protein [Dehalococcoides mccartyi]
MNDDSKRVRPRPNIADRRELSFRKRYESVGYWVLLSIVLMLVIWFIAASASNRSKSEDIEATVIATLFVPETATAEAEATLEAAAE